MIALLKSLSALNPIANSCLKPLFPFPSSLNNSELSVYSLATTSKRSPSKYKTCNHSENKNRSKATPKSTSQIFKKLTLGTIIRANNPLITWIAFPTISTVIYQVPHYPTASSAPSLRNHQPLLTLFHNNSVLKISLRIY